METQRAIINCNGRLTSNDVYKCMIDAIRDNTSEIGFVVNVDGQDHFTGCDISQVYDLIRKSSMELSKAFNRQIGVETEDIEDAEECPQID